MADQNDLIWTVNVLIDDKLMPAQIGGSGRVSLSRGRSLSVRRCTGPRAIVIADVLRLAATVVLAVGPRDECGAV